MRDESIFQCNGLHFDPTLKEPTDETTTKNLGIIPSYDDRAIAYTVTLTDAADIDFPQQDLTFLSYFHHLTP